ncbi:MAG: hypothetical protein FJ398_12770 [Verrucomicrobia bacterium]|nr:hypothetical protein [Verrucomicrobiota bacterium]
MTRNPPDFLTVASHETGRDAFHGVPGICFARWIKKVWDGVESVPTWFTGRVHGNQTKDASHEPDGRASLSPGSRVGRVPVTSSGSPGRTRPTIRGITACRRS